ncbi:MAG: ArsB/NhaD family transporter [Terracidiphilus sp.]|nr:ArsB/NhaD family transporter [Terracidiphilus sp.]MDR3775578.1 ArsB/NhaD family transporter [Terracidiphilus sp.]
MTATVRIVVTLAVFAAMLTLMVVRPRRLNEAWWTMLAAAAMLALGLVTPHEAFGAVLAGKNTLLFLLSLLALSLLVGKSGFFDWAAIRCALVAKGDAHSLYRNAFVAGAIITAILSLDTTAVLLTPVLLALVKRLKVPAAPYVLLCAFVANVGSLALPISNLTNLLFADAFRQTFAAFAARMIVPQLVALVSTYAILRWHFRRALPNSFDAESLPEPASVVPNHAYFLVCISVLAAVLVGYFLAPLLGLEPYVFAFAASAVLLLAGMAAGRVRIHVVRELAWDIFPFVIGLFIAVQGLENLGIVAVSSGWLAEMRPGSPEKLLTAAGATAFAANIVNNLPAALIARSVLLRSHAAMGTVLASLIGANVGPMITPFGSLATMLVLGFARRDGVEVRTGRLVLFGLWAVPVILVLTTLTLALTFALVR